MKGKIIIHRLVGSNVKAEPLDDESVMWIEFVSGSGDRVKVEINLQDKISITSEDMRIIPSVSNEMHIEGGKRG